MPTVHIYKQLTGIKYSEYMNVYQQSVVETANSKYSNLDLNAALNLAEQELYAYLSEGVFDQNGGCLAVLECSGRYLSALKLAAYEDGLLIYGLETATEERRRGYGKLLVESVCAGVDVPIYSHIHKKNAASLQLHLKCGFQIVKDHGVYLDGSYHPDSYTLRLDKHAKSY